MDDVDFVVLSEHHPPVGSWPVLDIRVNGVRLQELVQAAIQAASAHIGLASEARYMGLDPGAASAGHFLGYPLIMSIQGKPIRDRALLRCTCGELGCDDVTAEVRVEDSQVTWESFRARGALLPMGPFVFPRPQYDAALRRAAHASSV